MPRRSVEDPKRGKSPRLILAGELAASHRNPIGRAFRAFFWSHPDPRHRPNRSGDQMDEKALILSTIETMTRAFNQGDIDGVMRTYEAGAVVVGQPGAPVSGEQPLRSMFAEFVAAKAQFSFFGHEVVQAGELAIHLTPWRMSGVAPNGSPIHANGLSVAVLRRQSDGRWLMVIDHPFGDSLQRSAGTR
jgi:ketosteroid isomerase-like protein